MELNRRLYFGIRDEYDIRPLAECGVKNVVVLGHAGLSEFMSEIRKRFEHVGVESYQNFGWDNHHTFLLNNYKYYDFAFQYEAYTIKDTLYAYARHKSNGVETIPVATQYWREHVAQIPEACEMIGLGRSAINANMDYLSVIGRDKSYFLMRHEREHAPDCIVSRSIWDWASALTKNTYHRFQSGKSIKVNNVSKVDMRYIMEVYENENTACGILETNDGLDKLEIAHYYRPLARHDNVFELNFHG